MAKHRLTVVGDLITVKLRHGVFQIKKIVTDDPLITRPYVVFDLPDNPGYVGYEYLDELVVVS